MPTLVVGYSVKSRGIAQDLFGTEENYVLPVQDLKTENELMSRFVWLMNYEQEQNEILKRRIPDYLNEAKSGGVELIQLMNNDIRGRK